MDKWKKNYSVPQNLVADPAGAPVRNPVALCTDDVYNGSGDGDGNCIIHVVLTTYRVQVAAVAA